MTCGAARRHRVLAVLRASGGDAAKVPTVRDRRIKRRTAAGRGPAPGRLERMSQLLTLGIAAAFQAVSRVLCGVGRGPVQVLAYLALTWGLTGLGAVLLELLGSVQRP